MGCLSPGSYKIAALAVLIAASLARCLSAAAQDKPSNQIPCSAIDSIGTAEMANDGTITLHLQSLWPNPDAEGDLVYAPDDPQYDEIKQHIGDIHPGDKKPVRPWC